MRVLFFVPGGVDPSGQHRVIPVLLALIKRLAQNHHVTVVAFRQFPEPRLYPLFGATVFNLGYTNRGTFRYGNIPRQLLRLHRFLRNCPTSYDVIHAFFWGWPSTFALLAGRWLNVPVVASLGGGELVRIQDIQYGGALHWKSRWHVKLALRFAHTVTAGSRFALAPIQASRPDALKIPLLPESELFFPSDRTIVGPPWRLLTVSTVNRVKDPPTLLKALRIVERHIPEIFLDWIGEDILHGEAVRLAENLGLSGKVTFHGFQDYDKLPGYYHRAHLYVQASRHESQGVAVCEAAAAGLPLVGTDVGLLADLARQYPQAVIAGPVANVHTLADNILRILTDKHLRQELGANAFNWGHCHTAEQTAERVEQLYENLRYHQE